MKILAIEFSSPQRSVAVVSPNAGGSTVSEVIESSSSRDMKSMSLVEQALQQAGLEREQIECLAIGLGPGSYTGIRAAISLAQGWQLARDVKLLGVGSVECIVAQAHTDGLLGKVGVIVDAQRGEFYLAGYEIDERGWRETLPLRLATFEQVRHLEQDSAVLIGPEVGKWFPHGRGVHPRAAMLGQLAQNRTEFVSGEKVEPIYLREANFVKAAPSRIIPTL